MSSLRTVPCVILRELREDVVAGDVTERVVDALEVIDVEHQERERRVVAARVGDFLLEAIEEMFFVERLGEVVAERGVVHRALEIFFELVVVGELEDRRRAELDLVAVAEPARLHHVAVHERAVGAAEVLDPDDLLFDGDARVPARDAVVTETDGRRCAAPDDALAAFEPVHLADVRPLKHDQIRAVARAAAHELAHDVAHLRHVRLFAVVVVERRHPIQSFQMHEIRQVLTP